MPTPRSLLEILQAFQEAGAADLHKAAVGIVVAFYPPAAGQAPCADITLPVNNPLRPTSLTGDYTFEDMPTVPRVPVHYPKYGRFVLYAPLVAGDEVWVVFSDLPTGNFRSTGQQGNPERTERHGLDAICFPTQYSDKNVPADAGSDMLVGLDGDDAQIRISAGSILIGKGATEFVALADKVTTNLTAIKTDLTAIATAAGTTSAYAPSAVTATLTKAK